MNNGNWIDLTVGRNWYSLIWFQVNSCTNSGSNFWIMSDSNDLKIVALKSHFEKE